MGWISERAMRTGRSLNNNPSKQRRGPLRKIVAEVTPGMGMFCPPRVLLECGHTVSSAGHFKARCNHCIRALEDEP